MVHNNNHARFALLLKGVYNLLFIVVLLLVFTGSFDPTLLTESYWITTWFLLGLALFQYTHRGKVTDAQAKTTI